MEDVCPGKNKTQSTLVPRRVYPQPTRDRYATGGVGLGLKFPGDKNFDVVRTIYRIFSESWTLVKISLFECLNSVFPFRTMLKRGHCVLSELISL